MKTKHFYYSIIYDFLITQSFKMSQNWRVWKVWRDVGLLSRIIKINSKLKINIETNAWNQWIIKYSEES